MRDELKCICCNKDKEVLISVDVKNTSIFMHRNGVCQDCLKTEDINKICQEFEIRKAEESIEEDKLRITNMEEHLRKLKNGDRKE